jgi:hypothetical protein
MEATYPLREDLIQGAIDQLAASNAGAQLRRGPAAGAWQQERAARSGAFYARVTGPVGGYYIASHACRTEDAGRSYCGTYKICDRQPSSYWTAQSLAFGSCRHTEGTGVKAMASAEAAAALQIANMAPRTDRT